MAKLSACVTSILCFVASVAGASDPLARCCSVKLRAAASAERQLLNCHSRAAARGTAVDPACVDAAGDRLERAFARAESGGGCAGTGDAPLIRADLERVVGAIAGALRPGLTASGCAAGKLKATARLASAALQAFARQAPHPTDHLGELSPIVTELAQDLEDKFARLETGGDCLTVGDADSVATSVLTGPSAPSAPDGVLLTALRACGRCGDGIRGAGEDCDGIDASTCPGTCSATCTCRCGDGITNPPAETCDGADAEACPGLCQADCSCPPPVCGNGVKETGEQCDGTALGDCAACQLDCACTPPMCGNGVAEPGEECDGTDFGTSSNQACTFISGLAEPGCSECQCCALLACSAFGFEAACCPGYRCPARLGPNAISYCVPAQACASDADCASGDFCLFDGYCRTPSCSSHADCAPGFCVGVCCVDFPPIVCE